MMSGDDAICVRAYVKKRYQCALVVDQKVYLLKGTSEELNGFADQRVTVAGMLYAKALRVDPVKREDGAADKGQVIQRYSKSSSPGASDIT